MQINDLSRWTPVKRKAGSGKRVSITVASTTHYSLRDGRSYPMRELARILSVGSWCMPPRPFMKDFGNEQRGWINAVLKTHCRVTQEAITLTQGHRIHYYATEEEAREVGEEVVYKLRQWIRSGLYYKAVAPNAERTIARKHSDIPLVDFGQLADSIIWQMD